MLMKAKGDDLSTSDSAEETGYNRNQMANNSTVYNSFVFVGVSVVPSVTKEKFFFPTINQNVKNVTLHVHFFSISHS